MVQEGKWGRFLFHDTSDRWLACDFSFFRVLPIVLLYALSNEWSVDSWFSECWVLLYCVVIVLLSASRE